MKCESYRQKQNKESSKTQSLSPRMNCEPYHQNKNNVSRLSLAMANKAHESDDEMWVLRFLKKCLRTKKRRSLRKYSPWVWGWNVGLQNWKKMFHDWVVRWQTKPMSRTMKCKTYDGMCQMTEPQKRKGSHEVWDKSESYHISESCHTRELCHTWRLNILRLDAIILHMPSQDTRISSLNSWGFKQKESSQT